MLVDRWRLLLADESGFTLPELLTSMAILLTIMAGFTGLLVSTSRAELDMNNRFAARNEAQLGFSKLRREVHCAISGVTATGVPATPQQATLTLAPGLSDSGCRHDRQLVHRPERDRPLWPLALRRRRLQRHRREGGRLPDLRDALYLHPPDDLESRQARRSARRQPDPHQA